eukprot:4304898-Pyramimonas_sp.AAC.1
MQVPWSAILKCFERAAANGTGQGWVEETKMQKVAVGRGPLLQMRAGYTLWRCGTGACGSAVGGTV